MSDVDLEKKLQTLGLNIYLEWVEATQGDLTRCVPISQLIILHQHSDNAFQILLEIPKAGVIWGYQSVNKEEIKKLYDYIFSRLKQFSSRDSIEVYSVRNLSIMDL